MAEVTDADSRKFEQLGIWRDRLPANRQHPSFDPEEDALGALDGWGIDEQQVNFPNWRLNFGRYLHGDLDGRRSDFLMVVPLWGIPRGRCGWWA
jgi:hypothetical protein